MMQHVEVAGDVSVEEIDDSPLCNIDTHMCLHVSLAPLMEVRIHLGLERTLTPILLIASHSATCEHNQHTSHTPQASAYLERHLADVSWTQTLTWHVLHYTHPSSLEEHVLCP